MLGAPLKGDPQVVSGESGAVAMGLVATVMQDPDYQELREALQLDETSNVLMFSTEGDTDPDNYKNFMEVKGMDFNAVNAAAEGYREDMVKFLRDLVKIPGESAEEGNKIARAKAEMEKLGFDKIDIDPQGNLLGYMGSGEN